tara:strand:+ start:51 stop:851 length:801 start_codon:yes stop_codon:yes gene_type:complete
MRNLSQPLQTRWNPAILDRNRLFYALWTTFLFLILIWGVFWFNELYDLNWKKWGNHPKVWSDWTGVLTFPFLHGDLDHLWNNSATFFTLNGLLFYFYRSIALQTWIALFLSSGIGLWIFADGGNHIGASGLIYALAAFLFLSGIIRNSQLLLRVSLVVAFLYGGMVWWMLPLDSHISWEGHLAGAISGVLFALLMRNKGPVSDATLFTEDTRDELLPAWWAEAHPNHPDVIAQRSAAEAQASNSGWTDIGYTLIPKPSTQTKKPNS